MFVQAVEFQLGSSTPMQYVQCDTDCKQILGLPALYFSQCFYAFVYLIGTVAPAAMCNCQSDSTVFPGDHINTVFVYFCTYLYGRQRTAPAGPQSCSFFLCLLNITDLHLPIFPLLIVEQLMWSDFVGHLDCFASVSSRLQYQNTALFLKCSGISQVHLLNSHFLHGLKPSSSPLNKANAFSQIVQQPTCTQYYCFSGCFLGVFYVMEGADFDRAGDFRLCLQQPRDRISS